MKLSGVVVLALATGLIAYPQAVKFYPPFYEKLRELKINLGLDLQGGIHLEYKADMNQIKEEQIDEAMEAVQDVIERKVNAMGVAEPIIYSTRSGSERRLIVELAGVRDINEAKKRIGETPFLEFKEQKDMPEIPQDVFDKINTEAKIRAESILKTALSGEDFAKLAGENSEDPGSRENGGEYDFQKKGSFVPEYEAVIFEKNLKDGEIFPELVETQFGWHIIKRIETRGEGDDREFKSAHILIAKKSNQSLEPEFVSTGLTGKNLKKAAISSSNQGLGNPEVLLDFDEEGAKLFAEITKRNLQKQVAIYIDGQIVSAPTVQSEIKDGKAVISGDFTLEEVKKLTKRLNEGALPVPLSLISQQSVEASLGEESLRKSLKAGLIGLAAVAVFMIVYYRLLGLIAALALVIYAAFMVSLFKLSAFSPWQITLTLPGIAGFILSIGMAVDANILIFERTKEEILRGRDILGALDEGFRRAWTSIRDGNVSSIITALILVEIGTGFVKGFAFTLIVGVLVSMFTAVTISRTLIKFLIGDWMRDRLWLIGVGRKKE